MSEAQAVILYAETQDVEDYFSHFPYTSITVPLCHWTICVCTFFHARLNSVYPVGSVRLSIFVARFCYSKSIFVARFCYSNVCKEKLTQFCCGWADLSRAVFSLVKQKQDVA